jgi:ArsR family transcriptional regulator
MESLARTFKALSDPTRLQIMLLLLSHGHLCPCEVEQLLGITQSKASRHLRYLRNAGLLEDRRDGLIVNYHIPGDPDDEAQVLLGVLKELLPRQAGPANAAPLLVQIRTAREAGAAASSVRGPA